jgi:hypothetical protein
MKKNKHIRPLDPYGYRVEVDLPDGKVVVFTSVSVSFGHNDRGDVLSWEEKK